MSAPGLENRRVRLLRAVARFVCRRPVAITLAAAALAAAGLWLTATRMGYLSSTNDLIRHDAVFHRAYLAYLKEFRVTDDFLVLVEGADPEKNKAALADLAARFEASGRFSKVFYRIDFAPLEKRFLLFLPAADLLEMEKGLDRFLGLLSAGKRPALDLNSMLSRANSMFDEKFLRREENWDEFKPFVSRFASSLDGLARRLEGRAGAPGATNAVSLESFLGANGGSFADLQRKKAEHEFISFEGGCKLLIVLTPREKEAAALSPYGKDIAWARGEIAGARAAHPGVAIGLTGEPVLDADQIESSMRSVAIASAITLALIAGLFLFSYHECNRPLLAMAVLVIATLWAFGFTTLAVGHLNIISNAFVAMILGLGIDFGIQILGRYEEEISRGRTCAAALEEALAHTGNAVLTGAATTAAAFYTMCFNDFLGLQELGVIAGTGVLLCAAANLAVFPALIFLHDRHRPNLDRTAAPTHWRAGFFLREPFRRQPAVLAALAVAITAAAAFGARHARFDYNLLNLQDPALESVRVERSLLSSPAHSVVFAAITAGSVEEARAKTAALTNLPTVQSVASLADFIPEGQDAKLAIVARLTARLRQLDLSPPASDRVDAARARRELASFLNQSREAVRQARKFRALSARARDAEETFTSLIPSLERALASLGAKSQEDVEHVLGGYQTAMFGELRKALQWLSEQQADRPITVDDVPAALRAQFHGVSGKALIQVYPREDVWDRGPVERFVRDLRTVDPGVTGTPVQNFEYLEILRRAYQQAGLYSLAVICAAILLHFRSLSALLLTLLPLGLGMFWTVGAMPLFRIHFNPANIITLPLVIGIGVAYGIYAVDRFREDPARSLFDTSTGKSVWLSALTTMFGFGSLIQASYRGISSLGILMTLGVAMCLLTSLYFLPAMLRFVRRTPPPAP